VCCKPLQVVALKTKVYCLYSLNLCQRRGCPGSRLLLLLVQRFLLAARYFAAKSGYYVSQLCCFATNLGPSRVSFPVPFEPSTTHKCSLCFHLYFTVTVALALALLSGQKLGPPSTLAVHRTALGIALRCTGTEKCFLIGLR